MLVVGCSRKLSLFNWLFEQLLYTVLVSCSSYDGPIVSRNIQRASFGGPPNIITVTKPSDPDHNQAIHACAQRAPDF